MRENRHQKGMTFYCFSPPIMLATFIIEIALLAYVAMRYKLNAVSRLVAAMLFCLALFQLAEYYVCGGLGTSGETWSRIGFVAITLLPPVGLHLAHAIAKRGGEILTGLAYASAAIWVGIFAFAERTFDGHACAGNYVIFHVSDRLGVPYYIYYYVWLLLTIGLCIYFSRTATKLVRGALWFLAIGYLAFLIPTALVNSLSPDTFAGLPSIMCGFAIIYAFTMAFGILPRVGILRRELQHHQSHKKPWDS